MVRLSADTVGRRVLGLWRVIASAPGYALTSISSLAIAIAGTTVVFSVVVALLFSTPPYEHMGRLALVQPHPTWELFEQWRADDVAADGIVAYTERAANVAGVDEPRRILVGRITDRFLSVVGVLPAIGRPFNAGDFRAGHDDVALITDALWRRQFRAVPDIVGRALTLDDRRYIVIGVLPVTFKAPTELAAGRALSIEWGAEVLVPLVGDPRAVNPNGTDRAWRGLNVIVRLRPGATADRVRSDLAVIAARLPEPPQGGKTYTLIPLSDFVSGELPRQLAILTGAVALLLVITCANVANLALARSASRRPEFGIRMALGASRSELVGEAFAETVTLALVGGVAGIGLAALGVRIVTTYGGGLLSGLGDVVFDVRVLACGIVLSICSGGLASVLPALYVASGDPMRALRQDHKSDPLWSPRWRIGRFVFVSGQVTLSVILLAGAALLVGQFLRITRADLGFRTSRVLTADVSLSPSRYATAAEKAAFFEDLLERSAALPGVESVAVGSPVPGGPAVTVANVRIAPDEAGRLFSKSRLTAFDYFVPCETVAGDYFDTLSIPLRAGRGFDGADARQHRPVVVVNQSFAEQHWGDLRKAIGQDVYFGRSAFTIVGVAGDVREVQSDASPRVYFQYRQFPRPPAQSVLLIRGRSDVEGLIAPLTALVRSLDRNQPLYNVMTLERIVFAPLARLRLMVLMMLLFAASSVAVAALGVHAATSRAVADRMSELAIRLAVGSSRGRLFRTVVKVGMRPVLAGTVVGLMMAHALVRLLGTRLEGLLDGPMLPAYAGVALLVCVLGLAGMIVPAMKAMSADPIALLRSQ